MSVTRRVFFSRSLGIASAVVGCCAPFSNYAYAGGCASETRILGFGAAFGNGNSIYSLQIGDWLLGNCELRDAVITFQGGVGLFKAEVCTHFTHHEDVWHFRLKLFTGSPDLPKTKKLILEKAFDGPQMSEKNVPLFHDWEERFTFDPTINFGTLYGEATSCC